ncbi:MAG: hypothetical protein RL385_5142 [Pseudomonadota bacterium]
MGAFNSRAPRFACAALLLWACGEEKKSPGAVEFDAPAVSEVPLPEASNDEVEPSAEERSKESTPTATEPMSKSEDIAEDKTRVVVPFLGTVNESAIVCGDTYANVGLSKSTISLRDFRVYVHDVALIDAAGKTTPINVDDDATFQMRYQKSDGSEGGLVLLDFTTTESGACSIRGTKGTHTLISGHAPEGAYTRLTFTLGVPPELNHVNGALSQAPLNAYGMQWTWASGYRHLKLDVTATTGSKAKDAYYFHPGAAGCSSDTGAIAGEYICENPLNSRVELPFVPGKQAVQADLGRFFAGTDLAVGKGCMGTVTLQDPELDGAGVQAKTGCTEMWSTLGLALPAVLASSKDKQAERAKSIAQTVFASVAFDAMLSPDGARPPVAELSVEEPFGWPHPDFVREPELETSDLSIPHGTRSHAPGDARYGSNCTSCHEENGPGSSRYVISGTIYGPSEEPYTAGGVVQIGTGVGNRFGPTVHPIADKIRNFKSLFELPIDAYGQFYATADQAPGLDYAKQGYFARVMGNRGTCKSPVGKVIPDASGKPVSCNADGDCAGLSEAGVSAVCDKLLNAMPADTVGSCNFCHGAGFKMKSVQSKAVE